MTKLIYSRMLASVSYKDHPYAKEGEIILLSKKERRRISRAQYSRPKYVAGSMDVWRVSPEGGVIVGMVCIGRKDNGRDY